MRIAAHTVVLDIEGTTSAAGFIPGNLYDCARLRFARWIEEHDHDVATVSAVGQTRREGGLAPDASAADVVAVLRAWMGRDVKTAPLKTLQGLIRAEGLARGELGARCFDGVIPALTSWHRAGVRPAV